MTDCVMGFLRKNIWGIFFEYLFPKEGYDLIVDTYAMTTMECALRMEKNL